eukprot:4537584-Amphidinium_carterae.1
MTPLSRPAATRWAQLNQRRPGPGHERRRPVAHQARGPAGTSRLPGVGCRMRDRKGLAEETVLLISKD